MYEDLKKAVGVDLMSFTFDVLLNWALPLVMVVDHRNKTPETMEVLQNEWTACCLVKITPYHRALDIKRTAGERDVADGRIRGSTSIHL